MKATVMTCVAGLAGAAIASGFAMAAVDEEQNYQGIRYACTGVAFESRSDPRWSSYPLKLVFAQAYGDYLADVAVSIHDFAGNRMFEARCMAPWLLIDLPPGHYHVEATARESYTESVDLSVGTHGQFEHVVRFAQITN